MGMLGLMLVEGGVAQRGREITEFQGFLGSDSQRWLVVVGSFVVSAAIIWFWGRMWPRRLPG